MQASYEPSLEEMVQQMAINIINFQQTMSVTSHLQTQIDQVTSSTNQPKQHGYDDDASETLKHHFA